MSRRTGSDRPGNRRHRARPSDAGGGEGNHARGGKDDARALPKGLPARIVAVDCIAAVMRQGRSFDETFASHPIIVQAGVLETRDRAFARLLAMTVLRRSGDLEQVLSAFLDRRPPADSGKLWPILLAGAAQLLMVETPAHAAISLSVDHCRRDRQARRFDKLVNAVLRRVGERGRDVLIGLEGPQNNIPSWLLARWEAAYGRDRALEIVESSLRPAALDITVKSDARAWADRLGGELLPTGSIRLTSRGAVDLLPGFEEGAWWVQDAAAALPARLLGDVRGRSVADLCSAPGGKSAQLAAAGAKLTSVDISTARLAQVRQNMDRLGLVADLVSADVLAWRPDHLFDAVLLDAPCTATGTVRRHPDILHLRRESDIEHLAELQAKLLHAAMAMVAPGGLLVFATCSLEPEEGLRHRSLLESHGKSWTPVPVVPGECGIPHECLTDKGDLRTLPTHSLGTGPGAQGMDGFYATRWRRAG